MCAILTEVSGYFVSVRTAYKCRAYPDEAQQQVLARTFGCVRVVWNRTLAARHARYATESKPTSYAQTDAALTAMKKTPELEWLNEVSSVPLQQTLRHQYKAFQAFFAKRARYPRFKSRYGKQSATYTRSAFSMRDGELRLAKTTAPLAFVWSWPDIGPATLNPTTVTVSRDPCGRWYVSFAVEVAGPEQSPATGDVAGVDLGIKDVRRHLRTVRRSPIRGSWPAGLVLLPGISGGWPAARKGPRTASRRRRRWPARTGKSARPGLISCTAPAPGWSVSMTCSWSKTWPSAT